MFFDEWSHVVQEVDETYCIICGQNMGDDVVTEHVHGETHAKAMWHKWALHPQGKNDFLCSLCDCHISGHRDASAHLMGQQHQEKLMKEIGGDNDSIEEANDEDDDRIEEAINPWDFVIKTNDTWYNCSICNIDISGNLAVNDHVNGMAHLHLVQQYGSNIKFYKKDGYYCGTCDCLIPSYKQVHDHLMGEEHRE